MPKQTATTISVMQEVLSELKVQTAILAGMATPKVVPKGEDVKIEGNFDDKVPDVSEPATTPTAPESKFPVPMEYKEVVESVLNKEFGIECEPLTDKPAFTFTIIVPEQYSNATKQYRELNNGDRRSRVINYVEGVNGVRDWATKVIENLSPEARTLISISREQAKV